MTSSIQNIIDKKEKKRLYDIEYRARNAERLKEQKKLYSQTPAGRATQKRNRNKRVEQHNEYCRKPEYVKYKKCYDAKYRAFKFYGEYWESALLLFELEEEVYKRIPKLERAGYIRNKNRIVQRNKDKRYEAVIQKIIDGKVGLEVLRFNWCSDFKEQLKELIMSNR